MNYLFCACLTIRSFLEVFVPYPKNQLQKPNTTRGTFEVGPVTRTEELKELDELIKQVGAEALKLRPPSHPEKSPWFWVPPTTDEVLYFFLALIQYGSSLSGCGDV